MADDEKTILVFGATGAMGGAVVRRLLSEESSPWRVRAFMREAASPRAQALAKSPRVELAIGDMGDAGTLRKALAGAYGVFCNTDYWSAGSKAKEVALSKQILAACRDAAVQHVIYSSLEHCRKISGGKIPVPYFDSKAEAEEYIEVQRGQGDPWFREHVTVLVTAPYFENFQGYYLPKPRTDANGRTVLVFSVPMADKPFPMAALDDIGWFAGYIFEQPQQTAGETLWLASDRPTMQEAVQAFSRVTGIPADYHAVSLADFRDAERHGVQSIKDSPDGDFVGNMFEFIQTCDIHRDFEALRRIHPGLLTFEAWVRKTGWKGSPVSVQEYFDKHAEKTKADAAK
jgi:uncharacterized protein YbjT (DUF2867 family)